MMASLHRLSTTRQLPKESSEEYTVAQSGSPRSLRGQRLMGDSNVTQPIVAMEEKVMIAKIWT